MTSSKSVDCKLVSAERIAQQLNLTLDKKMELPSCSDVNRDAVDAAMALLGRSAAGRASLARYKRRGRPFCFLKDTKPPGSIGPLFVAGSISVKDNGTCLAVQSLAIGPQPLDSHIFPGVHYCKVISPARALEFILI